jgi:uncharacterized protein YyaL (SSP411 family)
LNLLQYETSPYLLQHAHNPVDWHPWGELALQKAREQNKPILVSIGYAACHWCHVMERESFEDEAVAALMNEHFINIKVDREERPDLDAIYMDAVQMISGSGGWPLNVFLTPETKPFYGGTYFPPVNAYNRSSWKDVLLAINQAWHEKEDEIIEQANGLTEHIKNSSLFGQLDKNDTVFSAETLQTISKNLMAQADEEWGGFGRAPKFPQTFSIQFLLRQAAFEGKNSKVKSKKEEVQTADIIHSTSGISQALLSLDKMIQGGIYDQLQGGFARYSTDAQWLAPHFEKMLYDNALLVSVICEAYQLTKIESYKTVVEQTMSFIKNEWQLTEGGFYSAYDADSEGIEGKYYVWEKKEIDYLLGKDAPLFCAFYDVSEAGNWEHTNILRTLEPLELFCQVEKIDFESTKAVLERCKSILLNERKKRVKPLLDDKILLSWNALMITACCKAYGAFGNEDYLKMATACETFIQQKLQDDKGRLFHNYKQKASNPAFLDDYASYIQALIHLQECTGNLDYLHRAKKYCELVEKDFSDPETPFFFYTPNWQKDVVIRKKDLHDGATPSGNSMMATNLFYLSIVFDIQKWKEKATEMLRQAASATIRYPTSLGGWASLLQQVVFPPFEIAITGRKSNQALIELLKEYIPSKVLVSMSQAKTNTIPILQNRWKDDIDLQLFLCEGNVCKQPVISVPALLTQIKPVQNH